MKNLLIVESGAKATKITEYLDKNFPDQQWEVAACLGHIRDLPDDENAVNPEDWIDLSWEETQKGKKTIKELRKKYGQEFEKEHGVKLGFMGFFVIAAVQALRKFPIVNASIDGQDIVYHGFQDIGVAVSTERGLVVPVIKDADSKSLPEIEKSILEYSLKARDGKLAIEDMQGGTFTISNGGIFGSLLSTPILNAPQTAILGMHAIQDRPVAIEGEVVIRPMMYLAMSYDHRLLDGKEAVSFLVSIKEQLESPERLVLNL